MRTIWTGTIYLCRTTADVSTHVRVDLLSQSFFVIVWAVVFVCIRLLYFILVNMYSKSVVVSFNLFTYYVYFIFLVFKILYDIRLFSKTASWPLYIFVIGFCVLRVNVSFTPSPHRCLKLEKSFKVTSLRLCLCVY